MCNTADCPSEKGNFLLFQSLYYILYYLDDYIHQFGVMHDMVDIHTCFC